MTHFEPADRAVALRVDANGNRFLLVDGRGGGALRHPDAWLASPDGEGADGLLWLQPAEGDARARMVVINRDGTRPEMCGNGLCCVARFLAGDGAEEFAIETAAGPRACRVDAAGRVHVSIGRVTLGAAFSVAFRGAELPAREADAGNPHAAVDAATLGVPITDAPLAEIARAVVETGRFPSGVNVELFTAEDSFLDARVFERGVGETAACGTGAAALAAVALARHASDLVDARVRVRMPGGSLDLHRDPLTGELWLAGPIDET